MAGTWLDFGPRQQVSVAAASAHFVREKDGGRHWARTSDLLHVKQGRGRSRGQRNVAGTTDTAPRAASRLDFGWTYRLLEGMEE